MIEGWWPTHSMSLAACLGALGMPVRTDVVLDERTGQELVTFYVGLQSLWNELLTETLLQGWHSGQLEQADPLHPFLCGLRACHNANLLASSLRNRLRLERIADDHATLYVEGEESLTMRESPEVMETTDLALVAALGVLGLPLIDGEGGRYRLPSFGHPLKTAMGEWARYDAQSLVTRLRDGSLERDEPQHPLVSAYNARAVHAQLQRHLRATSRRVLLRKPRSMRAAFIAEEASPDLLDRVRRHFRIP
jgi:hypothetical protein